MLVTITNASSEDQFISLLYKTLAVGESVTVSKSRSELDQELEFKKMVQAGTLTIAFEMEDGDSAAIGTEAHPAFSDTSRPSASDWPIFAAIWNTDDDALNWSDGANWKDAAGVTT